MKSSVVQLDFEVLSDGIGHCLQVALISQLRRAASSGWQPLRQQAVHPEQLRQQIPSGCRGSSIQGVRQRRLPQKPLLP